MRLELHPPEGFLRRLVDEPAGVSDRDRRHIAGCPQCLGAVAAIHGDAAWPPSTGAPGRGPGRAAAPPRAARSRRTLRRPAVAIFAAAVVLTGAGTAAAHDWLPIFRTEQIAPLRLGAADLVALPDLSAYGEVVVTRDLDVHSVPDAAAAAAATGLDMPEVTSLPRGVSGEPVYQVVGEAGATFTFSADRAARAGAEGEPLPPRPPGFDGAQLRLVAGPGVAQVWSSSAGLPALVVGRAVAPSAFSSGAPFETVRDYVLSLPGLPAGVAAQLRAFTTDGSVLPLPVPADRVTSSTAPVNGVPATVLATRDRTMAAAVWVDAGVVTAVAGTMDAAAVVAIARDLR